MARQDRKAATIVIYLEDGSSDRHELASDKDWSVIFEDVLEVKGRDTTTYYPLDAVRKWAVQARGGAVSPAAPAVGVEQVRQDSKALV
ncbi:MAG: hypothetical protein ACYCZX_13590 [Rhodospirillaceae bacterium]